MNMLIQFLLYVHNGVSSLLMGVYARWNHKKKQPAPEHQFSEHIDPDLAKLLNKINERQEKVYIWSWRARLLATIISVAAGLQAYAACALVPFIAVNLPLRIAVTIGGFWINLVFYWVDVEGTFVLAFVDGIHVGLTRTQVILTKSSFVIAACGGLAVSALFLTEAWELIVGSTLHFGTSITGYIAPGLSQYFAMNNILWFGYSISLALGYVALFIMGAAFFICITVMMYTSLAKAIREWSYIKGFLYGLVKRTPNKTLVQHIIDTSFKLFFVVAALVLASMASLLTLGSWQYNFNALLMRIPNASPIAAKWVSDIIIYGPAAFGRVPLVISKMMIVLVNVGIFIATWIYAPFGGAAYRQREWSKLKVGMTNYFGERPYQIVLTLFLALLATVGLGLNVLGNTSINIQGRYLAQQLFNVSLATGALLVQVLVGIQAAMLSIPALAAKVRYSGPRKHDPMRDILILAKQVKEQEDLERAGESNPGRSWFGIFSTSETAEIKNGINHLLLQPPERSDIQYKK